MTHWRTTIPNWTLEDGSRVSIFIPVINQTDEKWQKQNARRRKKTEIDADDCLLSKFFFQIVFISETSRGSDDAS